MELHKPVYKRLHLGLITFSAALMGVQAANLELLRPWAVIYGTLEGSATAAIPAYYYAMTSGHGLQPGRILRVEPPLMPDPLFLAFMTYEAFLFKQSAVNASSKPTLQWLKIQSVSDCSSAVRP
jgi:hypothetical protein